jgi:hypothetical protein
MINRIKLNGNGRLNGKGAHDVDYYIKEINDEWRKGVPSIIRQGQLLIEARDSLDHGLWEQMIEDSLPFGPATARALIRIATNEVLTNRKFIDDLPPSWGTLERLARIPAPALAQLLADKRVTCDLTQKQAEDLYAEVNAEGLYKFERWPEILAFEMRSMVEFPDVSELAPKVADAIYASDHQITFNDFKRLLQWQTEFYAALMPEQERYHKEAMAGVKPWNKREAQRNNRRVGQLKSKRRRYVPDTLFGKRKREKKNGATAEA